MILGELGSNPNSTSTSPTSIKSSGLPAKICGSALVHPDEKPRAKGEMTEPKKPVE